jgi:hypothetical protein
MYLAKKGTSPTDLVNYSLKIMNVNREKEIPQNKKKNLGVRMLFLDKADKKNNKAIYYHEKNNKPITP